MKSRVAVYGTLREGEYNHILLSRGKATQLGSTYIPGYIMLDLGAYPGVVPSELTDWEVFVEVYEVDQATLNQMDVLEGVGRDFYDRVNVQNTKFGSVFLYVLNPKYFASLYNSKRVISMFIDGDWMKDDSFAMEDEDIRTGLTEEYLKKAGLTQSLPPLKKKDEPKLLPAPKEEEFKLRPIEWREIFGRSAAAR